MANTILLPYSPMTNLRTSKRHHWRRYTTTMTLDTKRKLHSSSYPVHNSTSNLPDIVNDCHNRRDDSSHEMKSMCKEIAHSLRLVADHVDRKYCQNTEFNRNFHCLSIRLVLHAARVRTILYTLWARSFLPFVLLICKTKSFF